MLKPFILTVTLAPEYPRLPPKPPNKKGSGHNGRTPCSLFRFDLQEERSYNKYSDLLPRQLVVRRVVNTGGTVRDAEFAHFLNIDVRPVRAGSGARAAQCSSAICEVGLRRR